MTHKEGDTSIFGQHKHHKVSTTSLFNISQGHYVFMQEYLTRFNKEIIKIFNLN